MHIKTTFTFRRLCLLLLSFGLFNSGGITAQWISQNSPTTGKLETVFFVSPGTGFTSGGFTGICKTTDGGTTWSILGNNFAKDLYFVDTNIGYSAGVAGSGTMKKTINGAVSWTAIPQPNSSSIWGTFATSGTSVYFISTDNKVHKSTNSGASFTTITLTGSSYPTDIFFTDANTGFVVDQTGKIWRTTNAGFAWSNIYTISSSLLTSVYFVDKNTGFVCGTAGKILKTTDGGNSWTALTTGTTSAYLTSIRFYDSDNGLAVGFGGVILRTANGGATWMNEVSNIKGNLFSVFYVNGTTAIAVGDSGKIIKNSNITGINELKKNKFIQVYPNPMNDFATIIVSEEIDTLSFRMCDMSGKEVKMEALQTRTNQYQIERGNLKSGIYMLQFLVKGILVKMEKIVID